MLNYITKHWRGELSLFQTYWLSGLLGAVVVMGAALLAVAVGAHPAAATHTYGNRTCAEWTQDAFENTASRLADQAYVLGWLSALNSVQDFDLLADVGPDSAIGWITDYCRGHPTDSVAQAADHLGGALIARKTRPPDIGSLGRPARRQ
jgi:hypothetical protein